MRLREQVGNVLAGDLSDEFNATFPSIDLVQPPTSPQPHATAAWRVTAEPAARRARALLGQLAGWIDGLISRVMDILLAFPLLLFAIGIGAVIVVTDKPVLGLSGTSLSVATLIFIIGFFQWPYIGRIVRGQTLSLREKEFVDAARSLGASNSHIIFKQLLPNLAAPVLVYSTLIIPTNILFEAALSFLGVGVRPPTPSWGQMLSDAVSTYQIDATYMIVPGMALFITVMAFNLLGDGLRDALDPRAGR